MVGGRWVRDQEAHIVRLSDDIVKVSWDEPTGTTVSVSVDFAARRLHGVPSSPGGSLKILAMISFMLLAYAMDLRLH
jgi:hypothetical protein